MSGAPLPFGRILHSDWSTRPEGRWTVAATRRPDGAWRVSAPAPTLPGDAFVADLFDGPGPTLAGFDLPIGLPEPYGVRTGLPGFAAALPVLGTGRWARFYEMAGEPGEVAPERPFYPRRPGGTTLAHLLGGHGVASVDALMRECERGGRGRRAAGCLFWTLGPNQVGRAAIHGWQAVIAPARRRGAALWQFDGPLAELAARNRPVLAETYPTDALGQIGLRFGPRSRRDQGNRAALAAGLTAWADAHGLVLDADARTAMSEGFGPRFGRDHGFDALVGLFAAVAVVDGRRSPGAPDTAAVRRWEGWILGRSG